MIAAILIDPESVDNSVTIDGWVSVDNSVSVDGSVSMDRLSVVVSSCVVGIKQGVDSLLGLPASILVRLKIIVSTISSSLLV